MKLSFSAEGTRADVKSDINQQARALYIEHPASRTVIGAIAQEIGLRIADHSTDELITVVVDVDIAITPRETAKNKS